MPTLPAVPAFLASKRPSISRKRSVGGSSTSTRDLNREEKSAPYEEQRYEEDLQLKGFFMEEHDRGPTPKTTETYKDLFKKTIKLPQHIGFADELFQQTLKDIHGKNVARVIRDIGLLVCPSPEDLFKRGDILTVGLCESVDEAWILTQPILGSRPQPDFSVGFKRQAFTEEQLNKIRPLLGNSEDQASFFRATWYMYFPSSAVKPKKVAVLWTLQTDRMLIVWA